MLVRSLKPSKHKSGIHITQLLHVCLPPKIHHIPKDLLKEHLQVSRCIAKQDLLHFVCSFLHAGKLKRSHLSLHCCKYVLDRTEFGSMGRRIYHIYGLVLHNSHNEWAFMGHQVIMLKHQLLLWVLLLRRFHQLGKVVVVGLMRLTPSGYKLNLLTSMPTNTDCTGEVLPQILLVPLGN